MTQLSEFQFDLPPELIAQAPLAERSTSRLMVVGRDGGPVLHRSFGDIVDLLPSGCVLVVNETRVVPARFLGKRESGGKVEVLLVRPLEDGAWEALVRAGGTLRPPDEVLDLEEGAASLIVEARLDGGRFRVRFAGEDALVAAERCGRMPLPPYVKREATAADRETYQTVFARVPGAIAAPTAGLHFTPDLLARLDAKGVIRAPVVLHVGLGTFMPIRVETIEDHVMETERYQVPEATQAVLAKAKAEGRPIVACGTTSVRTLEAFARTGQPEGETDLFIYPPYSFRSVDGLITNFHLPGSTLLLLVSALIGVETLRAAYAEAVREGYRFYSYGDAMFIPPA